MDRSNEWKEMLSLIGTEGRFRGSTLGPGTPIDGKSNGSAVAAVQTLGVGTQRRRLPKGQSWPLRPSQIAEVLAELGAPQPTRIGKFATAGTDSVTLMVRWRPEPDRYFGSWQGGDEHVWVDGMGRNQKMMVGRVRVQTNRGIHQWARGTWNKTLQQAAH